MKKARQRPGPDGALHRGRSGHPHRPRCLHHRRGPHHRRQQGRRQARQGSHQARQPAHRNKVELYEEPVPLFHKYGIEAEIEQMYSRHVPLPSGRVAGDRLHRSGGGHRRQQRQVPRTRRCRDDRLQDRHGGRRRNPPPAQAARPGRRDHLRLHRPALRAASPRAGRDACTTISRTTAPRPRSCG